MRHTLPMLAACVVLLAPGCSQRVAVDAYEAPPAQLPQDASFYVMLPRDGAHGATTYPGSGAATANAVAAALSSHVGGVVQAATIEEVPTALRSAQAQGLSYVFESTILNWEDHISPISPRPDRLTLRYVVYVVADGHAVASTTVRSSSPLGMSGFHPADLLGTPTQAFVDGLF